MTVLEIKKREICRCYFPYKLLVIVRGITMKVIFSSIYWLVQRETDIVIDGMWAIKHFG